MKRSALKRSPLKRVSTKRKSALADYMEARNLAFEAANGLCQARVPNVCTTYATDGAHLIPRGQGGALLPGVRGQVLQPQCRACHTYATANPRLAREMGWLKRLPPREELK